MITLIGRARMMWATVAPVARPLLASAAIGWGIAALGTIAEERRAAVDQLGDLVAERLASLDRYSHELAEAAKLERAYSARLGELRAQLELAAADLRKSGIGEGTRPGGIVAGEQLAAGPAAADPAALAPCGGCGHERRSHGQYSCGGAADADCDCTAEMYAAFAAELVAQP